MSLDGFIHEYIIFWGSELDFWVKIMIFQFFGTLPGTLGGTPLPGLNEIGQKSRGSKFLIKIIDLVLFQLNLMICKVSRAQIREKKGLRL